jgi:uncharacterized protein
MSEEFFYKKYLSYKNKYLSLKNNLNLLGGSKRNNKKNNIIKILLGGGDYEDTLKKIFTDFNVKSDPTLTESLEDNVMSLQGILEAHKVSPCHGIDHAKKVMYHAWKALEDYPRLSKDDKLAVLLAALLHDADDGKFFPDNKNNENLRLVLKMKGRDFVENIVTMVNLVSSSKNGDNIPAGIPEWMVIPRYADRIEAIGLIGIERCFTYNKKITNPLFLPTTPRPTTEKEIWAIATKERYEAYNGNSMSMIDHYYDKLLRLSKFPIRNRYFDKECDERIAPLIEFLIMFGTKGTITEAEIEKFIQDKKAHISVEDE